MFIFYFWEHPVLSSVGWPAIVTVLISLGCCQDMTAPSKIPNCLLVINTSPFHSISSVDAGPLSNWRINNQKQSFWGKLIYSVLAENWLPNFTLSLLLFFTLIFYLCLCKINSVTQTIISRSEDNIKIDIKAITWETVDWSHPPQDRIQWLVLMNRMMTFQEP
jgi:hypothetical protein